MFSFRTTPLQEQTDLALRKGRVGVLCNQVAWNPEKGEYLFETLHQKGNLKKVFILEEGVQAYTGLGLDGCDFMSLSGSPTSVEAIALELKELDALVIELQDVGSRYSIVPSVLFNLFMTMNENQIGLSVYLLDRENPAGRSVEGTIMEPDYASIRGVEGLPHRHGLTIGEIAHLFHSEMGAKFPLHIISYLVRSATQYMMPWSIPSFDGIAGMFTCNFYSGLALWEGTNVSNGVGTTRPFEQFGAPFLVSLANFNRLHSFSSWNDLINPVSDSGVFVRWTKFTPYYGAYQGEGCFGFQLLPNPGVQYHSLAHQIRIIRFFANLYQTEFRFNDKLDFLVGDSAIIGYLRGGGDWDELKEHIKIEEQKWIRKAKRYLLYDSPLWRVKSVK